MFEKLNLMTPGVVKVVLGFRIFLYFILIILSFIIFVPISISMKRLSGECLLYSKLGGLHALNYGPQINCLFSVATSIAFDMILSMVLIAIGAFSMLGKYNIMTNVTAVGFRLIVLLDGLAFLFLIACGGVLAHGFSVTCNNYAKSMKNCEQSVIADHNGDNYKFYLHFHNATVSAWVSVTLWLTQLLIGLVTVVCATPPSPNTED